MELIRKSSFAERKLVSAEKEFIKAEEKLINAEKRFINAEKRVVGFAVDESTFYEKQVELVLKRTKLFTYKYPKLILFLICIVGAYYLFSNDLFSSIISHLGYLNYLGVFICGLLFSFGFTTPFATAILLKLTPENIFIASLIGGCGALIADLIIFKFIKISFEDEFTKLRKERPFLFMRKNISSHLNPKLAHYLTFAFAGILFASPLPDEAAVAVLASLSKINVKALALISFVFNSIGVFILLVI
ncbi:MAG: hypothetical protein WC821_01240 [archaeon]|jgi:hypothetical protein